MKFEKEEKEKKPRPAYDDEEELLCPECEGKGWVKMGSDKDLCYTCDGLGVIYAER